MFVLAMGILTPQRLAKLPWLETPACYLAKERQEDKISLKKAFRPPASFEYTSLHLNSTP